METNAIWPGPRLLVPLTIDGLVLTDTDNGTQFSIQSLGLANYKTFFGISPALFSSNINPPAAGIYLNWAIPDGMTRGLTNDEGRVEYPYLPNRWIVIRFSADPAVSRQAFIVESDWLGDNATPGGPVQPQYLANDGGQTQTKFIGKWYDMQNWKESGQTSELFLTAIGNSDPLFAAYTGNNTYVFSFIDKVTDASPRQMSYLVAGWYSNPVYDIMANKPVSGNGWDSKELWLKLMTNLQWSVGEETINNNQDLDNAILAAADWLKEKGVTPAAGIEGTLCAQTLCQGLMLDVKWPGISGVVKSAVPGYDGTSHSVPYVAPANTATDSLSAFMQWQLNFNTSDGNLEADDDDAEVEILLEAFSHKMLPQPGGVIDTPELRNAIRDTWYRRVPGGTIWIVQAPQKPGELKPADTNQPPPKLSPGLAVELAALNQKQSAYDKNQRRLTTLQKQLYADWLKVNIFKNLLFPPENVTLAQLEQAQTNSNNNVTALMASSVNDKKDLDSLVTSLTTELAAEGDLQLLKKPASNFYQPADPVFLINNSKRSFKRGEDTIYAKDADFLFVRFSGQFIKSLAVNTGSDTKLVNASDVCPPFEINTDIPLEIPDLLAEGYLLDTSFSDKIAQIALNNPPPNIAAAIQMQQTLVWNADLYSDLDKRTLESQAGFNPGDPLFHVPSKAGVSYWVQPWTPLYLEWEVGFDIEVDPTLSNWEFDGDDFQWKGETVPVPPSSIPMFQGRSILTPKEAVTLQSQLLDFINSYPKDQIPPDFVPLADVLKNVGNWDILSQSLTGFSLQLVQWDIESFGYQPPADLATAIGDEAHGMPVLSVNQLYPVRAGFAYIQKLWIVDDFGQVYNLMPNTGGGSGEPPPLNPVPGIGMRPLGEEPELKLPACFQLPPRVVQGSRLNFNLISAGSDTVLSSDVDGTTPVCGWTLPNHLNGSVMVYDNTGVFLGEVMLMGATGAYHAQWLPAPFSGKNASDIANKHLKGFIKGLLGGSATNTGTTPWSGRALANFLLTIDETLWSVDPMGERSNQSLSILVGRPVAIIRAALDLELYGNPNNNLSWGAQGTQDTGLITQYSFPIRVGNIELPQDGVMGYFTGDDYSTFNSVHQRPVKSPAAPPYVVNNFTNLQFSASPTYITLLLDPRGSIHCSTGITPVLEIELPDQYVGSVLDSMLVEFKNGPLLVDQKQWWLPLPAGAGQKWSWLQPQLTNSQPSWAEISGLVSANSFAQLSDNPLTIVEGRLKLTGALGDQLILYFFESDDEKGNPAYSVAAGTTVALSWASQGSVTTTLAIGDSTPAPVAANVASLLYVVAKTQSLKLTVTDAKGNSQSSSIKITAA